MELSPLGYDLLVQREAKRNVVYLDSEGKPTVGIGHFDPNLVVGESWTDEQVEAAFKADSAWTLACLALVKSPLSQNAFDSLFSFIWNIGASAWRSSTMLRMLNEDAPNSMLAGQFDRWHIPPEITTRRNGEKFQFLGTAFLARCDANGHPIP